ncbi:VanZ family protein [Aegicerativicinus sediminis]|uniref:VanZ family protein n=1 Tax=Aegicerativicinus sediminis TaxID=2893202 RepID=UPI0037421E4A
MLKKPLNPLFLIGYLGFITIFSLGNFGIVKPLGSEYDDKLNHIAAHAILVSLAYLTLFGRKFKSPLLLSFFFSIGYGIIIEVLQLILSSGRTFDFRDIIANIIGALLSVLFIKVLFRVR